MILIPGELPCEMSSARAPLLLQSAALSALLLGAACNEPSADRRLVILLALVALLACQLLALACCRRTPATGSGSSGDLASSRRPLSCQQRAKSCLCLDGQGSPDTPSPSRRKQLPSRARGREGRSERTKSWMPREAALPELSKSYSFPLRQKRAQECGPAPYWQTISYDLAVKFEARRRNSSAHQNPATPPDAVPGRRCCRKGKSASAYIGRLKAGFSSLVSRTRDDRLRKAKAAPLTTAGNLSTPAGAGEKPEAGLPKPPLFLGKDRPLIFYPRHLPFDRDRFESDVRKKMEELADDQKSGGCSRTG